MWRESTAASQLMCRPSGGQLWLFNCVAIAGEPDPVRNIGWAYHIGGTEPYVRQFSWVSVIGGHIDFKRKPDFRSFRNTNAELLLVDVASQSSYLIHLYRRQQLDLRS